jgi:hypothetical protein
LWMIGPDRKVKCVAGKEQGLVSTEGIALCADCSLLVGDGEMHRIYRVTREGDVSIFLDGTITKPESMAFDEQGNLYVADNVDNKVYLITPRKDIRVLISTSDGVTSPETLCYHKGMLYITDPHAGKIFRYTITTRGLEAIAAVGGKLRNVQGITADEDGTLLVSIQDIKHNKGVILRITFAVADRKQAD